MNLQLVEVDYDADFAHVQGRGDIFSAEAFYEKFEATEKSNLLIVWLPEGVTEYSHNVKPILANYAVTPKSLVQIKEELRKRVPFLIVFFNVTNLHRAPEIPIPSDKLFDV